MNSKLTAILGTAALLVSVASAHHSFSAEFDSDKKVKLEGKVARMEWSNPHTWLYIDVAAESMEIERQGVFNRLIDVFLHQLRIGSRHALLAAQLLFQVIAALVHFAARAGLFRNFPGLCS